MRINKLMHDILEKIEFIDKRVNSPFTQNKFSTNPFAEFYNGTYVWVEHPNKIDKKKL